MKLPVIRKLSDFTLSQLNDSVAVLETVTESRGVTEEELDVLGEVLSNIFQCLECGWVVGC